MWLFTHICTDTKRWQKQYFVVYNDFVLRSFKDAEVCFTSTCIHHLNMLTYTRVYQLSMASAYVYKHACMFAEIYKQTIRVRIYLYTQTHMGQRAKCSSLQGKHDHPQL